MLTFCNDFRLNSTNRSNNNTMKIKPNQTSLIITGVILAVVLSFGLAKPTNPSEESESTEFLSKYKSTVPLIVAPLHILAKGLRIAND